MYRSFLAWRYIRARRTNLIGIVGIFVAVSSLILILSIMSGFLEESRSTMRGSLSDLIIEPVGTQWPDADGGPQEPDDLLAAVREDERVVAACAQLVWYGILVQSGQGAARSNAILADAQAGALALVQLVGIDVADESATTQFRKSLLRGPTPDLAGLVEPVDDVDAPFARPSAYRPTGRPRPSVIVGQRKAAAWGLSIGSEIDITTAVPNPVTGELHQNNGKYVVAGTFRSKDNEMDLDRIYLERVELMDLLGGTRAFSHILVHLQDYQADGALVKEELTASLAQRGLTSGIEGEVRTWEEFRVKLLGAIENEKVLLGLMLSLVMVVAGFTVFAILSMMVTEKRRDIGILRALGATPGGILRLFLTIAFWEALIGTTSGTVVGCWAALRIDPIERWLSSTFGIEIFNRDIYLFDHIPSLVSIPGVAAIATGAFLCTLIFAAFPAWQAARLNPLDALRYE
jgi:lipoprotein-releasing system permease protein